MTGYLPFIIIAAVIIAALLIIIGIVTFIIRKWIKVARADEALVISGNKKVSAGTEGNPDGSRVKVIVNGKSIVNPITQRAEIISLRSRQVIMNAEAQSLDNITLTLEAVALVKIGSQEEFVRRAAERFASQDKAVEVFTTEQLEGALRGVVAKLSVDELMRERKKFSDEIAQDVAVELAEQGLVLDSFQIKGITDKDDYIRSLGIPQIQAKRQAAEISETNANREILRRKLSTDEETLIEQTQLSQNTEEANAKIGKARAQAEQAEAFARAEAEQAVLNQEALNKEARLNADVRRVAEADRYRREQEAQAAAYEKVQQAQAERDIAEKQAEARRLIAEADADAIRLQGDAKADAIQAEAEALEQNREALLAQKALEILPNLMKEFAVGYANVQGITIVGGGNDNSAAAHMATEQSLAMKSTFETVKTATGIDLGNIIQSSVSGRALGQGIEEGSKENHSHQE